MGPKFHIYSEFTFFLLQLRFNLIRLNDVVQKDERQRRLEPRSESGQAVFPRIVRTDDLFGTADEVRIIHAGQEYRLRITKLGKLILTK